MAQQQGNDQDPPITLPLSVQIKELLGPHIVHYKDHKHCVSIQPETAMALFEATSNEHTCHVQFPADKFNVDMFGKPIEGPLLWEIGAWRLSAERHLRSKMRAKAEKEALDIQRANVRLIRKAIMKISGMNEDQSLMMAHRWLTSGRFDRIEAVGVTKLITSVNEL